MRASSRIVNRLGLDPQRRRSPLPRSERSVVALDLAAGTSTVEERFVAPDPRSHTQTIEVTVEPVGSEVTVEFVDGRGRQVGG
jgi:hypothetical protein